MAWMETDYSKHTHFQMEDKALHCHAFLAFLLSSRLCTVTLPLHFPYLQGSAYLHNVLFVLLNFEVIYENSKQMGPDVIWPAIDNTR